MNCFCRSASPLYFSFDSILRTVIPLQLLHPHGDGIPFSVSRAAILCGVYPCRNIRKILRTVTACSSLITIVYLSAPLSYPRKRLYARLTLPSAIRFRCPQVTFSEMERLSSCAREDIIVRRNSPLESVLKMFSFSK